MFCKQCGNELVGTELYCDVCGEPLQSAHHPKTQRPRKTARLEGALSLIWLPCLAQVALQTLSSAQRMPCSPCILQTPPHQVATAPSNMRAPQ